MNQQNFEKVFIVSNDPFWIAVLRQVLKLNGYEDVQAFNNSKDCIDNLYQQPDLVLLNQTMDALSDLEMLSKIKQFGPDINVLFISEQKNLEVALSSLKYGAFDYIIKGKNEAVKLRDVVRRLSAAKKLQG